MTVLTVLPPVAVILPSFAYFIITIPEPPLESKVPGPPAPPANQPPPPEPLFAVAGVGFQLLPLPAEQPPIPPVPV